MPQRKFCYLLLFCEGTKEATKLINSVTVILTAVHLTAFWITLQIINQIPPQGDMSVISNLISCI